ncbi:MAG: hypothetical protein ACOYMB_04185 [Patescibacteria group bacterium]
MENKKRVEFRVKAELETENGWALADVVITGNNQGVFIDYIPVVKIWFNNVMLRFAFFEEVILSEKIKSSHCIIFDNSSGSKIKIKEIHQKLMPFFGVKQNSADKINVLPRMPSINSEKSKFLRKNINELYGKSIEGGEKSFREESSEKGICHIWEWSFDNILNDGFVQFKLGTFNFQVLEIILHKIFGDDYRKLFRGLRYHFTKILDLKCEKVLELKETKEYQTLLPFIKTPEKISIRDIYEFSAERDDYSKILTGYSRDSAFAIMDARDKMIELLTNTLVV